MKLGSVDYVRDPTPHDNFGGGSSTWVVWAHTWLVKSRSFFSFFLSFFLSFFFAFFATRPGIGTTYTSKCVFSAKDAPLGDLGQYMTTFKGSIPSPRNLPKMVGNKHFQACERSEKSTYLENWSTDWHKTFSASLDHQRSFVGGPVTALRIKMASDAILDFR